MLLTLLIVFMILQVLDAWTTLRVLRAGGRELNALMASLMRTMGREHALIIMKFVSAAIGGALYWQHQRFALQLLVFFYLIVVANNFLQMRRMRLI